MFILKTVELGVVISRDVHFWLDHPPLSKRVHLSFFVFVNYLIVFMSPVYLHYRSRLASCLPLKHSSNTLCEGRGTTISNMHFHKIAVSKSVTKFSNYEQSASGEVSLILVKIQIVQ
jgi:hypothetical protein